MSKHYYLTCTADASKCDCSLDDKKKAIAIAKYTAFVVYIDRGQLQPEGALPDPTSLTKWKIKRISENGGDGTIYTARYEIDFYLDIIDQVGSSCQQCINHMKWILGAFKQLAKEGRDQMINCEGVEITYQFCQE